jgi:PAS domain S-box-containing protein
MSGNQLIQATIDSLSAHIAIVTQSGEILGTNAAWKEYGLCNQFEPTSCCKGANYLAICDAVVGEERRAARAVADAICAVARGTSDLYVVPYTSKTPEGDQEWVARVSKFSIATPLRVVVSHEEITGLSQAPRAATVDEWPGRLIHSLPFGAAFVTDEAVQVNRAFVNLTGIVPGSVQSWQALLDVLQGGDSSPLQEMLQLESDAILEGCTELPVRHSDGSRRWVQLSRVPCRRGEIWMFHDVTETKELQIALGRRDEHARKLLEALPFGLVEVSSSGRVESVNLQAQELLDRLQLGPDPVNVLDWFAAAVDEGGGLLGSRHNPVADCLQGSLEESFQLVRLPARDGSLVPVSCTVTRMSDGRDGNAVVLTLREEFDAVTA